MLQVIGLDVANRSVKVMSAGILEKYVNRTLLLKGNELFLKRSQETIYEFDGKRFIIDNKGNTSSGRNAERYSSREYLTESLVAITKVMRPEDDTINAFVVAGLPCDDYKNERMREDLECNLTGKHTIKVNNEIKTINIECVEIIPQPLGTLVDFIFNGNSFIARDLPDVKYKYVIIDIGQGTTDILATDGLRVLEVHGRNIGCLDMMNVFIDLVNLNPNIAKDPAKKITANDITGHLESHIEKYEMMFDFSEELRIAKQSLTEDIMSFINDTGIDLTQYDRIIYTGGGAKALEDYLPMRSNYKVYPHAESGNAKGFYKYGIIKSRSRG